MSWSRKKVLVTGAGGFIGSHLTERLLELGAYCLALVRYNSTGWQGWLEGVACPTGRLEVVAGDVCDRDSVARAMHGVDVVFHLAALIGIPYSYQAPASYVRTNVEGTLNVLECACKLGVERMVHTSTSEVYGTARYVPIDETHPLQPQSPYSATKIGADQLALSFERSFRLPVVVVRPFNTYGPRQSARAIIPTIITQCLAGGKVRLGRLTPTRDLNFVSDTVEGFVLAGESPSAVGQVINLGSGREISVGDLTRKITDLMKVSIEIEIEEQRVRPAESEVERLCAARDRAKELLGWESRVTLDEGLAITIDWIKKHMNRYRAGTYAV